MAGVDDVIALLEQLRGGQGMVSRAVVLAQGAKALRQLSPQQRRELAIEVARRAAPHLIPRIEAETGADLTPAQIQAVIDLALRMDDQQIDDLLDTLRSPEQLSGVGSAAVGAAGSAAAEELGLGTSALDEDPELAELEAELEQQQRELAALEEEAERAAEPAAGTDLPDAAAAELPPVDVGADVPADADEADVDDTDDADDAEVGEFVEDDPGDDDLEDIEPATPELQSGVDPERGRAHVAAVRRAGSIRAQLAVVRAAGAALWHPGPEGRQELLRAIPDGWGRRRALERMIEADVVTAAEALELLGCLDRDSDRTWAAGTLLEHGVLEPSELLGAVPERALGRLARRHSATGS